MIGFKLRESVALNTY